MKVIVISAGHSLSDPGAVYSPGTKESFLTMELTNLASDIVRKHGVGVLNVPDILDLKQTITWINGRAREQHIDGVIEIHTNASTDANARGIEAWYYHDFATGQGSAESKRFGQCVVDAINAETGMKIRGVFDESTNRWGRLGFVHDTDPIATLVECGFISNQEDRNILLSVEGRTNIAKGIARGILTFIGEAWKPELLVPQGQVTTAEMVKDKEIAELKRAVEAANKLREHDMAVLKDKCQEIITAIDAEINKLKQVVS